MRRLTSISYKYKLIITIVGKLNRTNTARQTIRMKQFHPDPGKSAQNRGIELSKFADVEPYMNRKIKSENRLAKSLPNLIQAYRSFQYCGTDSGVIPGQDNRLTKISGGFGCRPTV